MRAGIAGVPGKMAPVKACTGMADLLIKENSEITDDFFCSLASLSQ
jgi:hypothetical protein